jgi:hypothetical protein
MTTITRPTRISALAVGTSVKNAAHSWLDSRQVESENLPTVDVNAEARSKPRTGAHYFEVLNKFCFPSMRRLLHFYTMFSVNV